MLKLPTCLSLPITKPKVLYLSVFCAWLIVYGFSGDTVLAQLSASSSALGSQQPVILRTANGVANVQITSPNQSGVSVNLYDNFNVNQAGLILNNSSNGASSILGGGVDANPFLARGAATTILNEVTSLNPSVLNGTIEVAGSKAGVIIANPNGISVQGLKIDNASSLDLTTGQVLFANNGSMSSYNVGGGQITITSGGISQQQLDYTNIIASAVTIDSQLTTSGDINVLTGTGSVDTSDKSTLKPLVAVDSIALGGQYKGSIKLIGGGGGVGVNTLQNSTAASSGVALAPDGTLQITHNANVSGSSVNLQSKNSIVNAGQVSSVGGNITIASLTGSVLNLGSFTAQANFNVTGNDLTNTQGTAIAGGNGTVNLSGNLANNNGTIETGGTLQVNAQNMNNTQGVTAAQGDSTLNLSGNLTNNSGAIQTGGALQVNAQNMNNDQGYTGAQNNANLNLKGNVSNNSGAIQTGGALQVNAQNMNNDQGYTGAQNNANLNLKGNVSNNGGAIQGGGAIKISAGGSVFNGSGAISGASTSVTAGGNVFNGSGSIGSTAGDTQVISQTGSVYNNNGTIQATGGNVFVTSTTGHIYNNQGGYISGGSASITAGGNVFNNSGYIGSTSGDAQVVAQNGAVYNNTGTIQATGGNLFVNASGVIDNTNGTISGDHDGSIQANGVLINTNGSVNMSGTVSVKSDSIIDGSNSNNTASLKGIQGDSMIIQVNKDFVNDGTLQANTNLSISTNGTFTNTATGVLMGGTNTYVSAKGDINNNSGQIGGGTNTYLIAGNNINSTDGVISATGTLALQAGNDVNIVTGVDRMGSGVAGTTATTQNIMKNLPPALGKGQVSVGTDTYQTDQLQASSTLQAGTLQVQAGHDINLTAAEIDSTGDATFLAGHNVNRTAVQLNSVETSNSRIALSTTNASGNSEQILKGTTVTKNVTNVAGDMNVGGALTVVGGNEADGKGDINWLDNGTVSAASVNFKANNININSTVDTSDYSNKSGQNSQTGHQEFISSRNFNVTGDANFQTVKAADGTGGNMTTQGMSLNVGGNLNFNIAGDLTQTAQYLNSNYTQTTVTKSKHFLSDGCFFCTSTKTEVSKQSYSDAVGNTITANSVTGNVQGNLLAIGTTLVSQNDSNLTVDGSVTLLTAQNFSTSSDQTSETKGGIIFGSSGFMFGAQVIKTHTDQSSNSATQSDGQTLTTSQFGSVNGLFNINTKGTLSVLGGSTITNAGTLIAKNYDIEDGIYTANSKFSESDLMVGLTLGVSGAGLDSAYGAAYATSQYELEKRNDPDATPAQQQQMLSSFHQQLIASGAGAAAEVAIGAATNPLSLVPRLTLTLGASQSLQGETSSQQTVQKSGISFAAQTNESTDNGQRYMIATGDPNAGPSVNMVGGSITGGAGTNIHFVLPGGIQAVASQAFSTDTNTSSSWNFGIGGYVGADASIGVTANAGGSNSNTNTKITRNSNSNIQLDGNMYLDNVSSINGVGLSISANGVYGHANEVNISNAVDTVSISGKNDNWGVNASAGVSFATDVPTPEGNFSANSSYGTLTHNSNTVAQESGIFAGSGGMNLSIDNASLLLGAAINSTASQNNNNLQIGHLTTSDLVTQVASSSKEVSASAAISYSATTGFGGMVLPLGWGSSSTNSQTLQGGIGSSINLKVADGSGAGVSRNVQAINLKDNSNTSTASNLQGQQENVESVLSAVGSVASTVMQQATGLSSGKHPEEEGGEQPSIPQGLQGTNQHVEKPQEIAGTGTGQSQALPGQQQSAQAADPSASSTPGWIQNFKNVPGQVSSSWAALAKWVKGEPLPSDTSANPTPLTVPTPSASNAAPIPAGG